MLRTFMAALLMIVPVAAMAQDDAKLELGKEVFLERAQPACAVCHTLADAGSEGDIGPNLDDLQPTESRVATAVKEGIGVMPSFADILSEEEIEAVAQYVSRAAGEGGE